MFFGKPAGAFAMLRSLGILAGMYLALGAARAGPSLTLEAAWQLAEAANPALRSAQASLDAAEGQLRDASGFLYNNPQLSTDLIQRQTSPAGQPDSRYFEQAVGLSQTFEIAGQAGYRRNAAERELAATRQKIRETRRQSGKGSRCTGSDRGIERGRGRTLWADLAYMTCCPATGR